MNRTKIEWTDYTTNPLGQGCDHGCWYCYAKRGARRNYFMHLALYNKGQRKVKPCEKCRDFIPHFHPERLLDPWKVKTPSKVFVCSTSDLFAEWTQPDWRDAVLKAIRACPVKHQFQLLTKQPQRIPKGYRFPDNVWVGATITQQEDVWKLQHLKDILCNTKYASFEPLLGAIECDLYGLDWIIIGKLTGSKRVKLKPSWVAWLVAQARHYNIPVFMKNNLRDALPMATLLPSGLIAKHGLIQEFPQ